MELLACESLSQSFNYVDFLISESIPDNSIDRPPLISLPDIRML